MLLISDNSATDLALKAADGGKAVNERIAAIGVTGISVDRPTIALIADAVGVKDLGPEKDWSLETFRQKSRGVTPEQAKQAALDFYKDRRDTSTPEGMARLLQKIWKREALSEAIERAAARHHAALPDRRGASQGAAARRAPRSMHKTGTLGIGVTNDVGIIPLP